MESAENYTPESRRPQAPVVQSAPSNCDLQSREALSHTASPRNIKSSLKKSSVINFWNGNRKQEYMYVKLAVQFTQRVLLLLLGYLVCYFNFSLTLPIVGICSVLYYQHSRPDKGERIQRKMRATSLSNTEILEIVKDLPSWVHFPDREKAQWLNEIISQLWPNVNNYIVKYCRTKVQTNIRKKFDSFRFEDIDFGNRPPRIDGVKVYNKAVAKDSIIIDFEIFYDGDCDINFSMSGAQIGRIKDFQMGVNVRTVLKPLLFKMPIIGGIQLFFLNIPDIHFDLEGITGIPGFSYLVRQKVEEIINRKLVFPNKLTKRFTKSIEATELRSIEAEGVLRVHVFEARDLEKKDITGKSDPYVILKVGAQEFKTPVIKRDLNPQWDYYCEFIILDPMAQQLFFKLFDQNDIYEDDFMGSGAVEIYEAIKPGKTDRWFSLEHAKHGKLHLRFSWLALSFDKEAMNAASEETKLLKNDNIHAGLLTIYIDSAVNLPKVKSYRRPDPFVILTVGNNQVKTRTKKHTCNPSWKQGLYLLIKNPENDSLIATIVDKHSNNTLDKLVCNIRDLLNAPSMQLSIKEFQLQLTEATLTISLQLRILHNAQFEFEDSDSDSGDEDGSRIRKRSSTKMPKEVAEVGNEEMVVADSMSSPRLSKAGIKETEEKFRRAEMEATETPPTFRKSNFVQRPEQCGRIELSLEYSELTQKFSVIVHRASSLPLKIPTDIPDPYVKLKLEGPGISPVKYRTKVVIDSCDPVYEEKFEYLLSVLELSSYRLIITVKNKKMFNSSIIGQKIMDLSYIKNCASQARDWFDLHEEEVSD
ncbi:extended synaptotagmin-2-B-like isoform X2 [Euwallacea fornicatus]